MLVLGTELAQGKAPFGASIPDVHQGVRNLAAIMAAWHTVPRLKKGEPHFQYGRSEFR
jgi:hypothetical protein